LPPLCAFPKRSTIPASAARELHSLLGRLVALLAVVTLATPQVFSVANCGSANDPTKLELLTVTPDPIVLGKNITIAFKGLLSTAINPGEDISASVVVQKQLFGTWITIPCIDNLGSCNYTNVCTAWDMLLKATNLCPILTRYHIPCACALNPGTYSIPPVSTNVPNPGISWLDGELQTSVSAYTANGSRLFCYTIVLTLSS